ncbi:PREDICTED: uncharacterized protein LOC108560522 [Nicrophorus vespilloides]|uniref:Uncharacterized protein LOC108560522 n=1 Tax=Nicrophorus vespilloides TaxID=110193 RepID=A0ABM1MG85_NICVS|nr:PREDICTED: uncharacterized protein LOC108560522 [Nicrophorus vespilloides]
MSSNSILNEHLMVRERLQEAYRKIIFISDHDFAQDPVYKKANQVLYARIKKLEENPEVERVRNVRDVIPSSNLARYGPYPYDEVRERAYTPSWWEPLISSSTICYHGPQQPAATVVESWTTPEVEQIFRHTIYAGSLNFNIYEAELEHLDKISVIEDMPLPSLVSACCGGEFRKFYNYNPVIEQLFERTTTKQLRNAKHPEAENYLPYYFNVKEYEDVLLRKKILAGFKT